jgi:hypothetical protein
MQEAASHADPRTTMRDDRARASLDRHATYIVAAFIAGPPANSKPEAAARRDSAGRLAGHVPPGSHGSNDFAPAAWKGTLGS